MGAFTNWLSQLQYEKALEILVVVAASLLCITIHEVSHGWAAYILGDPTARRAGRLSLNPLRHIDLMGLICMALAHFGWAKAVPIDPRNFRHYRRDTAIVSLAGPFSNVILAILALMAYSVCYWCSYYFGFPQWLGWLGLFFSYTGSLSVGLAVFNLIPIPPLDGSKILFSLLPQDRFTWLLRYERYGFVVLAVLLYLNLLDGPLIAARQWVMDLIWPISVWPVDLLNHLFI